MNGNDTGVTEEAATATAPVPAPEPRPETSVPRAAEAPRAPHPLRPLVEAAVAGPSPSMADTAPVLGGPGPALTLALTMFVEAVGYGVVAPTLPFLARGAGADEARIGFLVGLYAAVGLVAGLPLGAFASRYGRRILVLTGLGCLAVASFGFVLAPTYPWLVAARFMQGLGATAIWVGALTMAADLTPDAQMGRSLSYITGAWSLGFVVGPALGGLGSVRFPFVLYTGLALAALAAAFWILPETGRPGTRPTLAGIVRIFRRPAVLASAAATVALSFFYGSTEAFLPLLADEMNVKRIGIGLLFAIAGVPSIVLPRLVGKMADRVGDLRLILGGLAYGALLNVAFLPLLAAVPLWIDFLLLGVVEVAIYVPAVALLNRGLSNEERAYATGSHSYAFSAGFFLGPMAGGLILPLGGYRLLFATMTAVMLAATAACLALRRRIEVA